MLEEIKTNTEIETASSSDYTVPNPDCFNEDGTIDKYKYLMQFPNMTKHEKKMTRKKIAKFLDLHSDEKYFRLEIQGKPFGVNFVRITDTDNYTEQMKEQFTAELWDCINSAVVETKNFDYDSDERGSLEIWGITDTNEPTILYLYPCSHGVIEIGG